MEQSVDIIIIFFDSLFSMISSLNPRTSLNSIYNHFSLLIFRFYPYKLIKMKRIDLPEKRIVITEMSFESNWKIEV